MKILLSQLSLFLITSKIGETVHLVIPLLLSGENEVRLFLFKLFLLGVISNFYAAEDLQVFLSDAFNELKDMLSIKARARHDYVGMDPVDDLLKLCDKVKRFPVKKDDKTALKRYLIDKKPANLIDAAKMLLEYNGPLKGPNKGSSMSINFLSVIVDLLRAETVSESIVAISKGFEGLQKNYGKSIDDIFYADPPFIHLSDLAKRYGSDYDSFYSDINKATAKLAKVLPIEEEDLVNTDWKCPLHLMTAIRTKGKEFDTVIVLDANDGIWPNRLANGEEALEQERRVFYVATTRARQHLIYLVNETILDEPVTPTPYLEEMRLL
jgi:DNA helicase-2/ATP-dependent DNA helicase PcrA